MKSVKGTKTEKNLLTSFAGECQARMRYTYYAGVAKKEGFEQISAIFTETADQEKEHAERMFKYLEGGEVQIDYPFSAGTISTTPENLKQAAQGEEHEFNDMYPAMADEAEREGFPEIAAMYRYISVAERYHARRYRKLLENIEKGQVFKRPSKQLWRCRHCGYVHEGLSAPEICPSCLHAQAYYEIAAENY